MNQITYSFKQYNIRVFKKDGEPWFVMKDVCDVLGINKHQDALLRLDQEERRSVLVHTPAGNDLLGATNEWGLYNLISNNRKPEYREFKRWITHELIPSIRKTESYTQNNKMSNLEIIQMQIEEMIKQEKELEELKAKQIASEIKVNYFKDIVPTNSDDWVAVTSILIKQIANNMGGKNLIKDVQNRVYKDLEVRCKCNLDIRLTNFKKRCEDLGVPARKINAKNKLDVIAKDSKLVETYVAIVKEYAVKGRV